MSRFEPKAVPGRQVGTRPRTPRWIRRGLVMAVAGVLTAPFGRGAHEIPADVTIRAFVVPAGSTLRVVIRVPLTSMRDVEFPLRGPGYVDVEGATALLDDQAKMWIADYLTLFEDGEALPTAVVEKARISLPSDPSFAALETALAHLEGQPLPGGVDLILEQAMLDVLLTVPIASQDARFSIDPRWAHLGVRTSTVLRFVTPGGVERVFQYGGNPGLVRLDPRWHQAFLRFVALGYEHILDGIDHLLFLLCLVIPVRRFWPLVSIVTAFTVAHSITLIGSIMGLAPNVLWFPPLIETLIAGSIVYMALENVVGGEHRRRWMWAFGFGLVHGFGFSFALQETLQFAGSHLITSLLAFNVGVELGQLLVLVVMIPALALLFGKVLAERMGVIILSALVAHTAWHWMTERGGQLAAYDVRMPPMDALFAAALLRWAVLALIAVAVAWLLSGVYGRLAQRGPEPQDSARDEAGATAAP